MEKEKYLNLPDHYLYHAYNIIYPSDSESVLRLSVNAQVEQMRRIIINDIQSVCDFATWLEVIDYLDNAVKEMGYE